jgi:glycerol-3-phosphate cytidylyltransferase
MATVVGYTTGVYDLFHIGHLNVLRRASSLCDELVVGVTTDELSISRKGKKPLMPYAERADIVGNLRFVNRVVPQTTMDKMQMWREIGYDRMFVGDDWKGTDAWNRYEREFKLVGVEIVYLPYTTHTSSTILRGKVLGG